MSLDYRYFKIVTIYNNGGTGEQTAISEEDAWKLWDFEVVREDVVYCCMFSMPYRIVEKQYDPREGER